MELERPMDVPVLYSGVGRTEGSGMGGDTGSAHGRPCVVQWDGTDRGEWCGWWHW